jgi:hypothetical protein
MAESVQAVPRGITAERGDADSGGGYGDAAAEGAGVGRATDRGGIGLQSHMTVRRYLAQGGWVAYRGRGGRGR